jgi:hypothetical protein
VTRGVSSGPESSLGSRTRQASPFIVLACLLGFAVGWIAAGRFAASGPVSPTATFYGVVTGVDATGSAICVMPDGGSNQRCSIPLLRPGTPTLRVNQRVGVAALLMPTGTPGERQEAFVIFAAPP